MLDSILESSTIPLLEKLAVFGERRQEVLAGNIANFDTPGYKMRDLPVDAFRRALQNAVDSRQPSHASASYHSSAVTAAESVEDLFPAELFTPVEASPTNITFQDANNRDVEHATMEMLKNTMMQNFAIELMNAQMNMLQTAISERV